MRSRDSQTFKEMNSSWLKETEGDYFPCDVFIDKIVDMVFVNKKGYRGGVLHYTSEHGGLLLDYKDRAETQTVIGFFFENVFKDIEDSDDEEMQLRKSRYYDGETD